MFKIEKLGRKSIAGDELWTVVQYVDGEARGGDHHWVRERYAHRAARLYNRVPNLHGATSERVGEAYHDLYGMPMFDRDDGVS